MIEKTESFKKFYKVLNRISVVNFSCVFKAQDTLHSIYHRLISSLEKTIHKLA